MWHDAKRILLDIVDTKAGSNQVAHVSQLDAAVIRHVSSVKHIVHRTRLCSKHLWQTWSNGFWVTGERESPGRERERERTKTAALKRWATTRDRGASSCSLSGSWLRALLGVKSVKICGNVWVLGSWEVISSSFLDYFSFKNGQFLAFFSIY